MAVVEDDTEENLAEAWPAEGSFMKKLGPVATKDSICF